MSRLGKNSIKFDKDLNFSFENGNLDSLVKVAAGRTKPFKEVSEGQNTDESKPVLYSISALEKTKEFGGGGGEGKVADPHELMTAALIAKYGQEFIDHQITAWSKMVPVLSSGEHCPHHIRARKPFTR